MNPLPFSTAHLTPWLLLALVLLLTACATPPPSRDWSSLAAHTTEVKTSIEHWTTANGARVYYVQAPELPMLDVRVVFDAGSARDGEQPGVALLTNALLGQGAGERDADAIAAGLEGLGAQMGSGAERDMAWLTLRSLTDPALLDPALDLFGQVLTQPRFAQADVERERQRMLVGLQYQEQRPGDVAERAFFDALYGDHPYASPKDGTAESVRRLRATDLRAFYERHYVARNTVIAVVGNVDRVRAEHLVDQLTAGLAPGEPAQALPQVADLEAPIVERVRMSASQSHVLMGVPGTSRTDPDYFTLYVGNHVLGGSGLVSRISEEVREKRGLSYSAYSYFLPMARRGPFQLGLQTRNEQVDEALQVLRDTLVNFREEGPTQAELIAAKRNITGGFPLRIDSNRKIVEYIAMIGFYGLPLDYLDRFNERVEAVTVEQIREAFQRRVDPERMVTVVVGGAD
ncbi:MAG: insulinase family protein [Xanthomonadaceae bacterium]|nr:insulinase family protein [Xanthomonadaceae bacterium]